MRLVIRKVQFAPEKPGPQPSAETTRHFLMSDRSLHLEASLDKEVGCERVMSVLQCKPDPWGRGEATCQDGVFKGGCLSWLWKVAVGFDLEGGGQCVEGTLIMGPVRTEPINLTLFPSKVVLPRGAP